MTFAEMTPESGVVLVWIALAVGLPWCGWLLWRAVRKVEKKDERPEGADRNW